MKKAKWEQEENWGELIRLFYVWEYHMGDFKNRLHKMEHGTFTYFISQQYKSIIE
jgi:hypothetical protein